MPYNPNVPQPSDTLDVSQGDILSNFQQLDTSFGINHYAYSDLSGNTGKHNLVTTPIIVGAAHPTTAANEPKFYALGEGSIGVIQYSRGPSDAVPSPVTYLQSPSTAIILNSLSSTNLVNLTGITGRVILKVFAAEFVTTFTTSSSLKNETTVYWNGTNFFIPIQTTFDLRVQSSGSTLQLFNATGGVLSNIYWTIQMLRIQA